MRVVPSHVRSDFLSTPTSLELDNFQDEGAAGIEGSSRTRRRPPLEEEIEPLIDTDPPSPTSSPTLSSTSRRRLKTSRLSSTSSPEKSNRIVAIMEKVQGSKVAHVVDKLAVTSEPDLTNAQLMLTNFDLKPGAFRSPLGTIW